MGWFSKLFGTGKGEACSHCGRRGSPLHAVRDSSGMVVNLSEIVVTSSGRHSVVFYCAACKVFACAECVSHQLTTFERQSTWACNCRQCGQLVGGYFQNR